MPWCPKCRNEYKEGYTVCSDCGMPLVDHLGEEVVNILYSSDKNIYDVAQFIKQNGVESGTVVFDEDSNQYCLFVKKSEERFAKQKISLLAMGMMKEQQQQQLKAMKAASKSSVSLDFEDSDSENEIDDSMDMEGLENKDDLIDDVNTESDENQSDNDENMNRNGQNGPSRMPSNAGARCCDGEKAYEDKVAKAYEYKSSAFAMTLVGTVGLVALILLLCNVLPVKLYGMAKVLVGSVMGLMFGIFLIAGISAWRTYKEYVIIADHEKKEIDTIKSFLAQEVTKERVDQAVKMSGEADNEAGLYYQRISFIKYMLSGKFPTTNLSLQDKLAEDWYGDLYDEG